MKKIITKILFWLIKEELEQWNRKNAFQRVAFYRGLFEPGFINVDNGIENYDMPVYKED